MNTLSHDADNRTKKVTNPFQRFFGHFVSGSYPLFAAAAAALVWANFEPHSYHGVWHADVAISVGPFQMVKSLAHWIDEALMTIFFFVVGLEIKREFLVGGLATPKQAMLPIAAAVGGMLIPAALYALFNAGTETGNGWGIPMATDIAFSLAILGLLGTRVPFGLKLFLSAFAIADDLGAVLVIAVFYTASIQWSYFMVAAVFVLLLAAANRLWIRWTIVYVVLGTGLWFAILGSGVHATVAGVLVAFFIPARGKYDTDTFVETVKNELDVIACEQNSCGFTILLNRGHLNAVQNIELACEAVETPLQRLEHGLQSWVALVILPLFALANAGLVLSGLDIKTAFLQPVTLGIETGLILGKPLGVFLFTFLAAKLFKASLPENVTWRHILGAGCLGGIGFTMSLFISGLSFQQPEISEYAKLGILTASVISGIAGYLILRSPFRTESEEKEV
ncbi:MAG: Na+/H+ antiporter NhaA [Desulfobacteraceae bacterium]|nr:Na+/H+ antiporter NhaA [Desulfobacteraceae bacterium]